MVEIIAGAIALAIDAGAVIMIAAFGELLGERSGIFNMGLEGTMAMGAVAAFITVTHVPNPYVGLCAAILVGIIFGSIMGFSVVTLKANQVISGLALGFAGTGLARHIGAPYAGMLLTARFSKLSIAGLSDLPAVGRVLFNHDPVVYFSYLILPVAISFLLYHTRHGINLRACGENPAAADSTGVPIQRMRFLYACVGGAFAAAAGAYLVLAFAPTWAEGVTGGRGWIAVALVIFSRWRPNILVIGSLLFGITTSLGFVGQIQGWGAYSNILAMFPYISTIALLAIPGLLVRSGRRKTGTFPAGLGVPYFRESSG
jgi:simple sugar transport system permease protein